MYCKMENFWFVLLLVIKFIGLSETRDRRQVDFGIQMLGEECESNDECRRTPVDGTKVCLLGRCQCSSGHVPIDAYRCIRDFERIPLNTRIVKSSQVEELPGYGSMCVTSRDCRHPSVRLECFRGSCACLEGYVPLGKYLCYNIHGGESPVVTSTTIETTTTKSTTAILFHAQDNELAKSLGKLGNLCTNDYYCKKSVSQSHCYNGQCTCINGYISIDSYTCIEDKDVDMTRKLSPYKSLLGESCSSNQNCHTSDAICTNNICSCPNGYFPIDNWNCVQDEDASEEVFIKVTTGVSTTTTTAATTTIATTFLWWPWSPSSTKRSPLLNLKNVFSYRCLLNRQCLSIDRNSHCATFGRCVCNAGYRLDIINKVQTCIRKIIQDEDCD